MHEGNFAVEVFGPIMVLFKMMVCVFTHSTRIFYAKRFYLFHGPLDDGQQGCKVQSLDLMCFEREVALHALQRFNDVLGQSHFFPERHILFEENVNINVCTRSCYTPAEPPNDLVEHRQVCISSAVVTPILKGCEN